MEEASYITCTKMTRGDWIGSLTANPPICRAVWASAYPQVMTGNVLLRCYFQVPENPSYENGEHTYHLTLANGRRLTGYTNLGTPVYLTLLDIRYEDGEVVPTAYIDGYIHVTCDE